ncbi:hypothetical protein ISN44_Un75g000020 [Arabidopsis suecica]|uniref:Uncharacterized protein n=1 Tax=Arabidopsis suecica TaxID=45249 RepID=A0A8T1XBI0_ARASU|nr:hypothetical protein ISN44_Un117g000020 [Arabidopsis suecica]KAG7530786.1 hypothetical protein ISN44_Un75g000020 [Arabidopsis suecica]
MADKSMLPPIKPPTPGGGGVKKYTPPESLNMKTGPQDTPTLGMKHDGPITIDGKAVTGKPVSRDPIVKK